MTTTKDKLREDMKSAMKAHDSVRLGVIRYILSEVKNFEIDNGEQDENGVQQVIAKLAKQGQESITEYEKGGRSDLVDDESAKLAIIKEYLPEQLSDADLQAVISEIKAANPDAQFGQLIGLVKQRVGTTADAARVVALLKS